MRAHAFARRSGSTALANQAEHFHVAARAQRLFDCAQRQGLERHRQYAQRPQLHPRLARGDQVTLLAFADHMAARGLAATGRVARLGSR
ncbi:MAG TPA: hypothetical protein VGF26_30660, partial [Ramlibacter sp.]